MVGYAQLRHDEIHGFSPLHKLTELCEVIDIHPLTLLASTFAGDSINDMDRLQEQVRQELELIVQSDMLPSQKNR